MQSRAFIRLGHLVAAAVVAFWLVMMFLLVKDSILPRRQARNTTVIDLSLTGPEDDWQDFEEYYRVSADQALSGGSGGGGAADVGGGLRQIGAMRTAISRTTRPVGYRADFALRIGLRLLRRDFSIEAKAAVQLDDVFELSDFTVKLEGLNSRINLRGSVIDDKQLIVDAHIAVRGEDSHDEKVVIALDGPVSMLEAVRPLLLRDRRISVGDGFMIEVIDPVWQMKRGELKMVAEDNEVILLGTTQHNAIRMRSEFGGVTTYSWVTPKGRTLRRQLLPGRSIYIDAVESVEWLGGAAGFLQRTLEIERLDLENFRGVAPTSLEELASVSLFKDLDIIPRVNSSRQ
jgi:hypothetical protein